MWRARWKACCTSSRAAVPAARRSTRPWTCWPTSVDECPDASTSCQTIWTFETFFGQDVHYIMGLRQIVPRHCICITIRVQRLYFHVMYHDDTHEHLLIASNAKAGTVDRGAQIFYHLLYTNTMSQSPSEPPSTAKCARGCAQRTHARCECECPIRGGKYTEPWSSTEYRISTQSLSWNVLT